MALSAAKQRLEHICGLVLVSTPGRPAAGLTLLPDTNHVPKPVTAEGPEANPSTHADPHLPLAPGIIDAIARFVMSSQGARGT
ncbi:hypothetical protein [Acerihabitans arboris]|uniref:hypothetical protein n=1 Tax=Acerihabitans arboris TaxID=2691583 RepID=UPI001FEC654F|nr:hypothetical protein [Acerihabitans arboris]